MPWEVFTSLLVYLVVSSGRILNIMKSWPLLLVTRVQSVNGTESPRVHMQLKSNRDDQPGIRLAVRLLVRENKVI